MAVTVPQLAAELRIGDGSAAPEDPIGSILTRILAVSTTLVERYAPEAAETVQDAAVIRVAAYLYDSDPSGSRNVYPNALVNSGAAALLDMYRGPSAVPMRAPQDASAAEPGTGTGGDGIDQVARDRAATALATAQTAEGTADVARTEASQARGVADSASEAASDASAASARALQAAQAAQAAADQARMAADLADSEATRASAASTAAQLRADRGVADAASAQSDAEDAAVAAGAARAAATQAQAEVDALEGVVAGISARTPAADPPASRVWATGTDGTPAWRSDAQSGVAVTSGYERPWGDLPRDHGWLWELSRAGGRVMLYPTEFGDHLATTNDRATMQRFKGDHWPGEVNVSFRRRGHPSAITIQGNAITITADDQGDLHFSWPSSLAHRATLSPVLPSALDLEYSTVQEQNQPVQAVWIEFSGDTIVVDSDVEGQGVVITPQAAIEAQAAAFAAQEIADAAALSAQTAIELATATQESTAGALESVIAAGARLPAPDPPPDSSWSTDELRVPAWRSTPREGIDLTAEEWTAYGPLPASDRSWLWQLRAGPGAGQLQLIPSVNGLAVQGDANIIRLARYAEAAIPDGRVRAAPYEQGSRVHGSQRHRYVITQAAVQPDGQGALHILLDYEPLSSHAPAVWPLPAGVPSPVGAAALALELSTLAAETMHTTAVIVEGAEISGDGAHGRVVIPGLEQLPDADPPPHSVWATGDDGATLWVDLPQDGLDITGDTLSGWGDLPDIPDRTGWAWELEQSAGRVALTPRLSHGAFPLGDSVHQELIDWAAATLPQGHVWVRPRDHLTDAAQPTRVEVAEQIGISSVIIEGLLGDYEGNLGRPLTSAQLDMQIQTLDATDTVRATAIHIVDADVEADGPRAVITIDQQPAADALAASVAETARATDAETALGGLVGAEAQRAQGAEVALADRLDVVEPRTPRATADPADEYRVWRTDETSAADWRRPVIEVARVVTRAWADLPLDSDVSNSWYLSVQSLGGLGLPDLLEIWSPTLTASDADAATMREYIAETFGHLGVWIRPRGDDANRYLAPSPTFLEVGVGEATRVGFSFDVPSEYSDGYAGSTSSNFAPNFLDFQFARRVEEDMGRVARIVFETPLYDSEAAIRIEGTGEDAVAYIQQPLIG